MRQGNFYNPAVNFAEPRSTFWVVLIYLKGTQHLLIKKFILLLLVQFGECFTKNIKFI